MRTAFAIDAQWVNPAGGNWLDGANWSTQPAAPTNASYDVTIGVAGTYDVVLQELVFGTSTQVNSVNISATGATLEINSGSTLQTGQLSNSGTLKIFGGVKDARISGGGAATAFNLATLDAVTLATTVNVTAQINVKGDLTFDGGTLRFTSDTGSGGMEFKNAPATIGGTGTIVFDGAPVNFPAIGTGISATDLTIASGIVIETGTGSGVVGASTATNVTNRGTLWVTSGRQLSVHGPLHNQGTIQIDNGTFRLMDTTAAADIGTVVRNGGLFEIGGTVTSAGQPLDIQATFKGDVQLSAGSLDAALITSSGSGVLRVVRGAASLTSGTGTTLQTDTFVAAEASLSTAGDLTVEGKGVFVDQGGQLLVGGDLLGDGEVVFQRKVPIHDTASKLDSATGGTLTIGSGITVRTDAGTAGADVSIGFAGSFVNEGIISSDAANGGVSLSGVNWRNDGTLRLNNGILLLGGSVTTANMGTIVRTGGTLTLGGISLDNRGSTFTLDSARGTWQFVGGTITGGAIMSTGGNIVLGTGNPTLDGVLLRGDLSTSQFGGAVVLDGLTLESATLRLKGRITFSGDQDFGGTGTLFFDSSGSQLNNGTSTLTIGSGIVIETGASGGTVGSGGTGTLNTAATILGQTAGGTLTIAAGLVNNSGTIGVTAGALVLGPVANAGSVTVENAAATVTVASNSGSLVFRNSDLRLGGNAFGGSLTLENTTTVLTSGAVLESTAVLERVGGRVTLGGLYQPASGAWDVSGPRWGFVYIGDGAEIDNARVTSSAGSIEVEGSGTAGSPATVVLDGVTVGSTLNIGANTTVVVNSGLTLDGATVHVNAGAGPTKLSFGGNVTLGGTGVVDAAVGVGGGAASMTDTTGTLTVGSGIAVRTAAGNLQMTTRGLVNNGVIASQTAGATLAITASTFRSEGVLQATNGGILRITAPTATDLGKVFADSTGIVDVHGAVTMAESSETDMELGAGKAGELTVSGTATLDGLLKLSLASGYVPTVGDTFTLVTAGSVAKPFAVVDQSAMPAGLALALTYGSTAVTGQVVAVPEVASVGLLLGGSALLLGRRRRRGAGFCEGRDR
jgi:hypothetical protein